MPTSMSPEEADRIATEYYARIGDPETYRVERMAELPELQKFYYLARWNLDREPKGMEGSGMPLGSGGFFVSLSTGEIEDPGSGAVMRAYGYLSARGPLAPGVEFSYRELADLLARYSSDQLFAMWELQRKGKDPHRDQPDPGGLGLDPSQHVLTNGQRRALTRWRERRGRD